MTDAATSPTRPINVLIADGQIERRDALSVVLSRESDFTVVAEVARGDELVDSARDTVPDVAIVDIELPGLDGISAAAQLRYEMPECQVIIIATLAHSDSLERALQAGASGSSSPTRQPRRSPMPCGVCSTVSRSSMKDSQPNRSPSWPAL